MKKILTLVSVSLAFFLIFHYSSSANYIFDEENNLICLGGYTIEIIRYEVDNTDDLYLKRKIYKLDIEKRTANLLIEADNSISLYEVSNKEYIAVSTSRSDEKEGLYKEYLIIYNKKGEVIKSIKNVPGRSEKKYFSWSEDGGKITYISGKSIIEGRTPFVPEGVWIYDVETDKTYKISDKGVDVNWSKHDNNIYIINDFKNPTDISVYNPSTRDLVKSDKNGIIFSDDGKYYIGYEEFDNYYLSYLYDNNTNKKIFVNEDGITKIKWMTYKKFINSQYIFMWDVFSNYSIFDLKAERLMRNPSNKIVGWNSDMTKLIVYDGGGKFVHIESTLTGERLKSIPIPEKE